MTTPAGTTPAATRWAELRRHYWQELWILLLVGLLTPLPVQAAAADSPDEADDPDESGESDDQPSDDI